jgi:hypothetical protein
MENTVMHPLKRQQNARPAQCLEAHQAPPGKRRVRTSSYVLLLAAIALSLVVTACGLGARGPEVLPEPPDLFTGPEDAVMLAVLLGGDRAIAAVAQGPERDDASH